MRKIEKYINFRVIKESVKTEVVERHFLIGLNNREKDYIKKFFIFDESYNNLFLKGDDNLYYVRINEFDKIYIVAENMNEVPKVILISLILKSKSLNINDLPILIGTGNIDMNVDISSGSFEDYVISVINEINPNVYRLIRHTKRIVIEFMKLNPRCEISYTNYFDEEIAILFLEQNPSNVIVDKIQQLIDKKTFYEYIRKMNIGPFITHFIHEKFIDKDLIIFLSSKNRLTLLNVPIKFINDIDIFDRIKHLIASMVANENEIDVKNWYRKNMKHLTEENRYKIEDVMYYQ